MILSPSDQYETPPDVFEAISKAFGPFNLDVCAQKSTAKCDTYFSIEEGIDALGVYWNPNFDRTYAWMNPPYSNPRPWVEKALEQSRAWGMRVVALLPADTSTRWYHLMQQSDHCILLHPPGRIRFWLDGKPAANSAKFGSVIAIFHPPISFKKVVRG